MYDVITIGAATRDVFLLSDNFRVAKDMHLSALGEVLYFNLGSKNELKEVILTTGGGATNAAVTFARQGLKTACICRVGDEESGHDVVRALKNEGIATELIQHDKKSSTAYSTILTTQKGERVILTKRGASDHIDARGISSAHLRAKWLYISSVAGDIALLRAVCAIAHANGIRIACNPGARELEKGLRVLEPVLRAVDVLFVNQEEAAQLTSIPYSKENAIFQKLDEIVRGIVVMTKGPKGVVVSDGKKIYKAGIPRAPIVGRTGAGDAFGSGFIAALAQEKPISLAIQLGTANATSVVQHLSAKRGILHKGKWGTWARVAVKEGIIKNHG
ncbi:MAG: carbohydrate kinase family protein [Candidatus Azambacteria bacterium]|nr:carbohydrate kinase family protein [Candidatus Azambacteria bacterium]